MTPTLSKDRTRTGRPRRPLAEDLRLALPRAVLARPEDDGVGLAGWLAVAETLEATAHALACCSDGTSRAVVDVLVEHALRTAVRAEALLRAGEPECDDRQLSVERSWWRLAALVVGAAPADLDLLRACLRQHRDALGRWADGHPTD